MRRRDQERAKENAEQLHNQTGEEPKQHVKLCTVAAADMALERQSLPMTWGALGRFLPRNMFKTLQWSWRTISLVGAREA